MSPKAHQDDVEKILLFCQVIDVQKRQCEGINIASDKKSQQPNMM